MNKITKIIAAATFALGLTACGTSKKESASSTASDSTKLTVIATANPHAVILEEAKSILKNKYNIDLEVTVTDDYFIPNEAVSNGEADANYFQHIPYLEAFNKENGTKVVSVGAIHNEPMGLYAGKTKSLDSLKKLK